MFRKEFQKPLRALDHLQRLAILAARLPRVASVFTLDHTFLTTTTYTGRK